MPPTVAQALEEARLLLADCSGTPDLDAQVLMASVLAVPRTWVLAHPEAGLELEREQDFRERLERCRNGEALAYVLGQWEFFGRSFGITPDVLIPRPETELLVERALDWLAVNPGARLAVDVGTGSGCIAVTLAAQVPDLRLLATDVSAAALRVTRGNTQAHGVADRVILVAADLLGPLAGPFDLICANLPYVPTAVLGGLEVGRKEPRLALDGGRDGLALLGRLLEQIPARLRTGGAAMLEIEAGQGLAAGRMAQGFFPAGRMQVLPDLAGRDRLLILEAGG